MIYQNGRIKLLRFVPFFLFLLIPAVSFGQYKGEAVKKEKLIQALRSKQFQSRDITRIITDNGVDFRLTPAVENELVSAGARPLVIDAVRSNYRAPVDNNNSKKIPIAGKNNRNSSQNSTKVGAPLTKDAILVLLQNGVADGRIQQNVRQRGVNFQMNEKTAQEIKAEGGSTALVNLMSSRYIPANSAAGNDNSVNNSSSSGAAKGYDTMIDQAVELYDVIKDRRGAIDVLQKAANLQPNNPRAYQLLGFMNLYGLSNFIDAERYMNESLTRGGSTVFRVSHDHDGVFRDTCQGSLYIAKNSVRFESDDNKHTFDTPDSNIKEVKMNASWRRLIQIKRGSYKIVLKNGEDKDGIKFSFAPLTGSDKESNLVIRLIGKNS